MLVQPLFILRNRTAVAVCRTAVAVHLPCCNNFLLSDYAFYSIVAPGIIKNFMTNKKITDYLQGMLSDIVENALDVKDLAFIEDTDSGWIEIRLKIKITDNVPRGT